MKNKHYELITTETGFDMPYNVSGKDRASVLKDVRKKLWKGEKIISLNVITMKDIQVLVSKIYRFSVDDDLDLTDEAEVIEKFADFIESQNMTGSTEFYENAELVCSDCGISLTHEEEIVDGKCLQCSGSTPI